MFSLEDLRAKKMLFAISVGSMLVSLQQWCYFVMEEARKTRKRDYEFKFSINKKINN